MHYHPPRGSGLFALSSQTIATGLILGGSLLTATYYFYVTSRSTNQRLNSRRKGAKSGAVPALYNLGNTCYANSLLQALAGSPCFVSWISSLDASYVGGTERPVLIEAISKIMKQLNDPSCGTSSAADVISALLSHRWTIPMNSEQDVYELLNVLITTWEEELTRLKAQRVFSLLKLGNPRHGDDNPDVRSHIIPPSDVVSNKTIQGSDHLPNVVSGSLFPLAALSFEHVKKAVAEERRSRAPCQGMLATQLQCCQALCRYKKLRQDKFCVLSLTIPKCFDGMMITLETLLRKFFCAEVIQGACCDRCVEMSNKTCSGLIKKQGFCKLPSSLVLRVERVGYLPSGTVFKQSDRFMFPETLDIRDFCFYRDTIGEYSKSTASMRGSTCRVLGGATCKSVPSMSTISQDGQLISSINESPNANTHLDGESTSAVPDGSIIDGSGILLERRRWLKYKYHLRSVIVHMGQPHSGHFISYRRGIGNDHQNAWYRTSDTQVTRVAFSEVAQSEAYMLFYDRVLPSGRSL